MFCSKCGARNSDEAVYCQKCGFRLEAAEEETVVARRSPKSRSPKSLEEQEGEKIEKRIFTIRPTLLFVKIGYAASVAGAFLLVVGLFYFSKIFSIPIAWWISVLAGLSLLLIPAFYHIKRNIVRYTLTDSKIEIDSGFISQNTRNVPLRTIQDVSVSSSVLQRMLGFGNLVIENANEMDGKVVLKNIDSPKQYADVLLKQMRLLDK